MTQHALCMSSQQQISETIDNAKTQLTNIQNHNYSQPVNKASCKQTH